MGRRTRYNRYDDDFKATAVSLTEIPGVLAKHVAEALDIHEVMLYRWRMEMRRGQIMAKKKDIQIDPEIKSELKRLRKLEREHNLLQEEHALLKKAIQFSLQQKGKSSSS
ncbi:Transposase [Microbulbifer donghaiensis]|uniref:Transposase n=1 Tax=Microbulbifer donghaiensis TaxID=494016 RepID=A0A1M5FDZ5_9GAMM|nr:transposase [Microbulbifer donghaiensis]SHF20763.1 Transposase [Microbulbifer donghaiensis]SHF89352.1 Transposase [Microbulbifer donghaiensis]